MRAERQTDRQTNTMIAILCTNPGEVMILDGRFASEEEVLKIIHSKSVPIVLYELEVCPLNKADLNSLDFVINRFL